MNVLRCGRNLCKSAVGGFTKQLRLGFPSKNSSISTHSRTMWHMCSFRPKAEGFFNRNPMAKCCRCGSSGLLHTKGEKSLVDFLTAEIQEERKAQKMSSLPRDLDGFTIAADGAELSFKKQNNSETITITMNVNHSVDTDETGPEGSYADEMKAKPSFDVDIIKKDNTLSFSCSFVSNYAEAGGEKLDVYQIDEVTLFEGEWNEKNYSVAGDILDENLYDLFMSLLSEKGITNEFIEDVSEIATYYEHSRYIYFLEEVHKFAKAN